MIFAGSDPPPPFRPPPLLRCLSEARIDSLLTAAVVQHAQNNIAMTKMPTYAPSPPSTARNKTHLLF